MQAQRATLSSTEIELYGRQIAHHIVAAKRHQEKRDEHKKSAALLLIAVKEQLPHGEYGKWLAANAISQDIANRLVQQFTDPEAATQRLAAERQRQAEMRQAASKFRKFAEPDDYPSRKGGVEAPPQQPQPSRPQQPPVSLARERLKRIADQYTEPHVQLIVAYAATLE
jgi:hypothetical protein